MVVVVVSCRSVESLEVEEGASSGSGPKEVCGGLRLNARDIESQPNKYEQATLTTCNSEKLVSMSV